jgi:COMPASS component SWD2
MRLTKSVLQSLEIGRVFDDNEKNIISMDFSFDGKFLVTSSEDESIHLYDCLSGK